MILITGGGIVGLAAGLFLAEKTEETITILAGLDPVFPFEGGALHARVSALTRSSVSFLESLNVWQGMRDSRVFPLKSMMIFSESPAFQLNFSSDELREETLGFIVENDLMTHVLFEKIKAHPRVMFSNESFVSAEKSGEKWRVSTDQHHFFDADLVIGADGADSFVRQFFQMNTQKKSYHQRAIVTMVATDKPHFGRAVQHFFEKEILGFLPVFEGRSYSLVWSLNEMKASEMLEKNDAEFMQELSTRMSNQIGNILSVDMRFAFPLTYQYTDPCYQNGVVLLGDAYHRVHPLAGQGVNLAFKDIVILGDVIRENKNRYALGDEFLLARFQRRAKSAHLPMCFAIDAIKTIFSAPSFVKKSVLSPSLSMLNQMKRVKRVLMREAG